MTTRNQRQEIAAETVQICKQGYYPYDGKKLPIQMGAGCTNYGANHEFSLPSNPVHIPEYSVVDATTLEAGFDHRDQRVCLLNFASAKNPGGGFLKGSQAQEESLARASGLYWLLKNSKSFYERHKRQRDPIYTNSVIHSQYVPVFRDDDGTFLPAPWYPDVVTCAAPNYRAAKMQGWDKSIRKVFASRIDAMLKAVTLCRPDVLVLGAWGCGVFGNDPKMVAELFHEALTGKFQGDFKHIIFAVPFDTHNREPFEKLFK